MAHKAAGKDLSKRVNLLLSATCLESLSPTGLDDIDSTDTEWLEEEPDIDDVIKRRMADLKGPADGV